MFKSFGQDPSNVELIEERTFGIAFDEDNDVKFRLGLTKTKKYLVIQALVIDDIENSLFEFFQTKLTLNNLKEKSDAFGNDSTMDECYQIITNLFEENKVEIKDIAQMKYLKLSFKFDIKNLDINLPNKKIDIDNNILLENFQINYDEFVSKKSKKIESSEIKNEEKANAEENKIEENNENINENINNEVENAEIANNEERGEPEVQYDENYNNEEENANNEYQENAENQENVENQENNEEEIANNEYQENVEVQENENNNYEEENANNGENEEIKYENKPSEEVEQTHEVNNNIEANEAQQENIEENANNEEIVIEEKAIEIEKKENEVEKENIQNENENEENNKPVEENNNEEIPQENENIENIEIVKKENEEEINNTENKEEAQNIENNEEKKDEEENKETVEETVEISNKENINEQNETNVEEKIPQENENNTGKEEENENKINNENLLNDKIDELLKKISLLEKEKESIKKENSELKKDGVKYKNKSITLEKENNSLKTENNSLKKENTSIKNENDSLKKEKTKLQNDNEYLKKEIEKLKAENQSYKDSLAKSSLTEEKLKKSNQENNNLKIELQKLKNEAQKKQPERPPQKPTPVKKKQVEKPRENEPKRQMTHNTVSVKTPANIQKNEIVPNKEQIKKESKEIKENKEVKENKEINDNKQNKEVKNNINIEPKKENKTNPTPVVKKMSIQQSKSPVNLKISKTLTKSSYIEYSIDNAFDAFETFSGEILLVYSTKIKSIECFDLVKQKFKKTILNAHNSMILVLKYYRSEYMDKEMIISSSNNPEFSVKIWDINTWSCIYNINKVYDKGNMLAVCILFDEYQKESYIFTSNDNGCIKIYGMDQKFIKNMSKTENNETYFLDTYYDERELKYFLIAGEMKCVKSYELSTHQLFRTYLDTNSYAEHTSAFVYKNLRNAELVECEFYGYIRIWNFHSGTLIKKIEVCKRIPLVSMCLWNNNYLLASCVDYTIKLIDFKNHNFIKGFSGHENEVCTIKKIVHPTLGECLISQGLANEQIKMWTLD